MASMVPRATGMTAAVRLNRRRACTAAWPAVRGAGLAGGGVDGDDPAAIALPEHNRATGGGEQGVVAAAADVVAGVELGTALAHDDRPGRHRLAAETLDAEALGRGVAPVAGRSPTFSLRHRRAPPPDL